MKTKQHIAIVVVLLTLYQPKSICQDFEVVGYEEPGCYILEYKKTTNWGNGDVYHDGPFQSEFTYYSKCLKFYKRNFVTIPGTWMAEHVDYNISQKCTKCEEKGINPTASSSYLPGTGTHEKRLHKEQQETLLNNELIYDEYESEISYAFDPETGKYNQLDLSNSDAEKRPHQELKEAIQNASNGINHAFQNFAVETGKIVKTRSTTGNDERPHLLKSSEFDLNSWDTVEPSSRGGKQQAVESEKTIQSVKDASGIIAHGSELAGFQEVGKLAKTMKNIARYLETAELLYSTTLGPRNDKTQIKLFENGLEHISRGIGGLSGPSFRRFAPSTIIFEETSRAALNRASALVDREALPSESTVFVPIYDWQGKVMGIGPVGQRINSYSAERLMSWAGLRTQYGWVEGTKRKVWYYLLEDIQYRSKKERK